MLASLIASKRCATFLLSSTTSSSLRHVQHQHNEASASTPIPTNLTKTTSRLVDLLTPRAPITVSQGRSQEEMSPFDEDGDPRVHYNFYDPPYIKKTKPMPSFDLVHINLRSYNYVLLDHFYKHVAELCQTMNVQANAVAHSDAEIVESKVEAFAYPMRSYKTRSLQPFSTKLEYEYNLNMYQRVVTVTNLKATVAPLLFEAIQLSLPESVNMFAGFPTKDELEFRYIPDVELRELRIQLIAFDDKRSTLAKARASAEAAEKSAAAAAAKASAAAIIAAKTEASAKAKAEAFLAKKNAAEAAKKAKQEK